LQKALDSYAKPDSLSSTIGHAEARQCMAGKRVLLVGPSTMREILRNNIAWLFMGCKCYEELKTKYLYHPNTDLVPIHWLNKDTDDSK
jgi:hypothetical protein